MKKSWWQQSPKMFFGMVHILLIIPIALSPHLLYAFSDYMASGYVMDKVEINIRENTAPFTYHILSSSVAVVYYSLFIAAVLGWIWRGNKDGVLSLFRIRSVPSAALSPLLLFSILVSVAKMYCTTSLALSDEDQKNFIQQVRPLIFQGEALWDNLLMIAITEVIVRGFFRHKFEWTFTQLPFYTGSLVTLAYTLFACNWVNESSGQIVRIAVFLSDALSDYAFNLIASQTRSILPALLARMVYLGMGMTISPALTGLHNLVDQADNALLLAGALWVLTFGTVYWIITISISTGQPKAAQQ
jgi:hypothetical protein